MKVLVVSLLRLGDLIQQQLLIKGLREKYPGAEIHLMLNRQFANAEKILSGKIDKFIYFDREQLQRGLGEASFNILWSYQELKNQISELNSEKYDVVYNFTHNRLSGYLIGALNAPKKIGLFHENGRFQGIESRWMRYFNERFSGTSQCLFNYVELLARGLEIPVIENRSLSVAHKKSKLILFQCLTSDAKKNWGLERFLNLKTEIERSLVDYEICILGAPFERDILAATFGDENLLICDLVQARQHLQNAALLVTGDTSIKHLAAQVGTPVVELVLGSSDATKTGAFTSHVRTVTTQAPCAPCEHSKPCSQKSHLCAEDITVGHVFSSVWDALSGEANKGSATHRSFERVIWSIYLDGKSDFTSNFEGLSFMISLQDQRNKQLLSALGKRSQELENSYRRISEAMPSEEFIKGRTQLLTQDVTALILAAQDVLRSKVDEGGYFQVVIEALLARYASPIDLVKGMAKALVQVRELLDIRSKYLDYMKSFSMEGEFYAKGIGQLSSCGFEETGKSIRPSDKDADL